MDDKFLLKWVIEEEETRGNSACKIQLSRIILDNIFSLEMKDGWYKLGQTLSIYYNPKKTEVYKDGSKYHISHKDNYMIIIPDCVINDAFIMILYKRSPYDAYRSYIYCKIENNKYNIKSISDFEGHIAKHKIIYEEKKGERRYSTWNFDSRNYLHEILADGIIIIYINHRDAYFDGCATIHCHNVNNNKRWMYVSKSKFSHIGNNVYVEDKILKIGNSNVNYDISNI